MNKELFSQYAEIERQIAELEAKKDELRSQVQSEMEAQSIDQVKADYGTFFFTVRKSYKYSPEVDALNDKVKARKKQEEAEGTATCTETKSLTFKAIKAS